MAHKRKGQFTATGEWAKHLRKFGKRFFWKAERKAEKVEVKKETSVINNLSDKNAT